MVYATNLQFAQRSGIGLRIVDEVVGTGNGTETDYDLDHDNIIGGSYTLSYAASGSNNFTALTETTHYALDKESGKIVLTATGATVLSTNILYANYWYIDSFSDTVITDFLSAASDEVDKLTGRKWSASNSAIDYLSGRATSDYPTTDEPFQADWDEPDALMLQYSPVSKINAVYYLNGVQPISLFYNYDSSGVSYTDKTDEVNSSTESPFTLFAATPASDDIVYIGSSHPFLGLEVNLSTVGTGSPVIDWEYYDGSSWADITETETDSGSSTFEASGKFTWSYPFGWTKTSVNSSSDYYWIRGKVTTGFTIAPICAIMTIKDSVMQVLEPRQFDYETYGKLILTGSSIPNGTRNVRIDYVYGESTTPSYITNLTVWLAAIQSYISLSGGSYDDATSYSLGSKSVTIGEVYVNIREVIDQFKKKVKETLDMIGSRADLSAI